MTDAASSDSRPMFNKKMRKPSMRFGRAGASVLQDGSASLIAGVDEEDEEEAEGGARGGGVDGKSSSQTRRPSQSGNRRRPSGESRRGSAESTSDQRQRQGGAQRRRSSRPSTQVETRRASGDSGGLSKRRGAPPMGPVPSMTDAALKDLIETSLNEEKTARAPLLRTSTSPNPTPLKVVLMGRVLIPSSKGASIPTGSNGRDKPRASRSRVHSVCIVMEDRTSSAGSYWSGSVRDITVHPGPEGREFAEKTVVTNRGWNIKGLSGVEKRDGTRETEGAAFTLTFETGRSSSPTAVGQESSYTWEGVNAAACDEILWGLLTLNRAMQEGDELEPVNVSLKELDATAVYHGLATKHPLVPKLARQMRADERSRNRGDGGSAANVLGGGLDGGGGGHGRRPSGTGRRGSDLSRSSVEKARRSSKGPKWDYEEFEQGEAVLGRLKWLEKGREGLLEELSDELEGLEGSTIHQLIAWSEKTAETETLISMLDEVDQQLQVMEGWLEQHGKPLEAMQVDMAEIERKNNKLDVQWRNYQNLHEYLKHLVEAISISPSNESMLRNPQVVLDAALNPSDEDPTPAVEKVVAAAESLSTALASIEQLAAHESTSSLQLLADQRAKLMGLAEITCSQLMGFCRRLLKRLTSQEGAGGGGGGVTPPVSGPPSRDRRNSGAADTSTQRLMLAQRQFHGHLIDYELIFAQVRKLDESGQRSIELQAAYAEDLNQGLLKSRTKSYFADLIPRIVFHHSSPGLASMERSLMGDGAEPSPVTPGPTISAVQLTPVAALKQCLDQMMPAVAREQAFFSTLFGLDPAKEPHDRDAVHKMLEVGFGELKAQLKQAHLVTLGILMEFKGLLMHRFGKFIKDQVSWIQAQRGDAKKAGILAAVAKAPTLLKRLQAASNAAVVGTRGNAKAKEQDEGGEAQKAYQRLVIALFEHVEEVASRNPKYEHMVRLENYHFFAATMRPLKVQVLSEYVEQADKLEEVSTTRYLEWLVGYQFPVLTQFFAKVEDLVMTVGAADVTYHEPKRNLEATLKRQGDMKVISEGLKATHQRMVKHVTKEGQLLGPLWAKLSDTLFAMFSRYEELCTLCYQHTLDPGAVAVKRAATEIGGGGPPSRSGGNNNNMPSSTNGGGSSSRLDDGEESGLASPSSAGGRSFGGGSGAFGGSFSSLTSPTHTGRDSSGSGVFGVSGSGAHTPPGGGSGLSSPRAGGGNSPVHRGKQFFAKHLRM
ncbi:conserved unknown protein [Ectocarpus siliculosus]|uniref:Exocyst complex component Sec3 C-terminal domain-containing protein n=1 Tax=Ectocarpus siliculosus TaxID=2880 RepID=D7G3Y9_ECTSI|nr:conserved unknown protein [Ectocarpus siliculosus]|eukprot:CBJ27024.1 conserved unknown protein [Ectocarpus siliculosus]